MRAGDEYAGNKWRADMNSDQAKRKSNRLADYDYSQNGAYFITICAKDRAEIFSTIRANPDGTGIESTVGANCVRPQLSPIGIIVEKEIQKLSKETLNKCHAREGGHP